MEHIYNCTGHELKLPNIVNSDGVYLFDDKGQRFMDLESGVWCVSVGHKNKQMNKAIIKQIGALTHAGFCYSSQILEEASRSLLNITNCTNGKCVFLCSGSEAIEISRQISSHLTGNNVSMTLHDTYLGAYTSVTDRSQGWYLFDWDQCKSCEKNDRCDPSCEALLDIPKNISDFVFEPGSSSGFVRFPPKALIQKIVNVVRQNNGKIIINEVTTGVGRTGKWFGYQHYDIEPDLIAVGKGIGNGYPVSVAVINESTASELKMKPFKYAQSHQNDPLGAAVVQAVIQEIEYNDLIVKAEQKGAQFLCQLQSFVDNKIVLEVRGRGMMFAMDLVNEAVVKTIYNELLDMGYIVGNRGPLLRIDPPLIITEAECDSISDALKSILACKQYAAEDFTSQVSAQ